MKNLLPYTSRELQREVLIKGSERVDSDVKIASEQIKNWLSLLLNCYKNFTDEERAKCRTYIDSYQLSDSMHWEYFILGKLFKQRPMLSELGLGYVTNSTILKEMLGDSLAYSFLDKVKHLYIIRYVASMKSFTGFSNEGFYLKDSFDTNAVKSSLISWEHLCKIKDKQATILGTKDNYVLIHRDKRYEMEYRFITKNPTCKPIGALDWGSFNTLLELKDILVGQTGKELKFAFEKDKVLDYYITNMVDSIIV